MAEKLTLVVGVLTYRRPQMLAGLLPQLARQLTLLPEGVVGSILVVDNDPAGSARPVVVTSGATYVHEPTPGISAARQRCLDDASGADLLQFIDDDEEPVDDWLARMVSAWLEFGRPAAVPGRVLSRFVEPPSGWIVAGGFFDRRQHPRGATLPAAPAGNLLLHLPQVRALGVRFDPELGLRGGEDTLFTKQLVRRGGRIQFCDDAAIVDVVPPERATREWVLRRAWFHGGTYGYVRLRLAPSGAHRAVERARLLTGGGLRAAAGLALAVIGRVRRDQRAHARGLRIAWRGAGMASGALGRVPSEYER